MDLMNNFIWLYTRGRITKELLLYGTSRIADVAKEIEESDDKEHRKLTFYNDEQGQELSKIYAENFGTELLIIEENT